MGFSASLLLLFLFTGGTHAFVFSCNEVKNKLINANLQEPTRYVCLVPEEGYSGLEALKTIYAQADKVSTSFADLLKLTCVERPSNGPWRIVADLPVTLDCTKEFSLIFTSSKPNILRVTSKQLGSTVDYSNPEDIVVVAQTGIKINNLRCEGDGNVTIFTGAGSGVAEYRYQIASWRCPDMPEWIVSFENVITVAVDKGIRLGVFYSAHDYQSAIDVTPSVIDAMHTVVMASGRSDDLQLLNPAKNIATFKTTEPYDVPVTVRGSSSLADGSFLTLRTAKGETKDIYNGNFEWNVVTSQIELQYNAIAVKPSDLWDSQDNFVCEFFFVGATPVSTPKPVIEADPYCGCGLDPKFGMPVDWDPTEIWLDVVIILDISEAMGDVALVDATTLIESFFGTVDDIVLNTDTKAEFCTRVGLIAMSDTADVLYNLNMTIGDDVNVKIKKGVKEINVVDAFYAAQSMLKDGRQDLPDRATTRPVIYYMTDSDPKIDLSPLNAFKLSDGVIIVNDFIEAGVFERPGLKNLASPGYYSTDIQDNYMDTIQLFCKANCYCRKEIDRDPYAGNSNDPAVTAAGGCYHAVPTGVQYNNLKTKNCDVGGGKIASVHDQNKNAFLNQLMRKASPKSDYFWIGYTKTDAGWTWEDQSTNPFTNWDKDEPSTASVAKCAYVDTTSSNLMWGAGNCNTGFPGVCEYAPCSVGNNNC